MEQIKNNMLKLAVAEPVEAPLVILPKANKVVILTSSITTNIEFFLFISTNYFSLIPIFQNGVILGFIFHKNN
jgi:hypothetical protein